MSATPVEPARCTCARLRSLSRRVSQKYDLHLAEAGLRVTQYSLLAKLSRNEGVSVTRLADELAMDRTTLVRNLKPLTQAGYVSVESGASGNTRAVHLTATGRALLRRAQPLWARAEKEVRATLGEQSVSALHALLDDSINRLGGAD